MQISFHKDPVVVADLCTDLEVHGAVYWHTSRPNFKQVLMCCRHVRVLTGTS